MSMMTDAQERLLSPAAVRDRLSISDATIARWLRDGVLPSVKFGKARRIPESAVVALMKTGTKRTSATVGNVL